MERKQIETEKQRGRRTERQRGKVILRQRDKEMERRRHKVMERQIDGEGQTDRGGRARDREM